MTPASALETTAVPVVVPLGGIVGAHMAPSIELATLPVCNADRWHGGSYRPGGNVNGKNRA